MIKVNDFKSVQKLVDKTEEKSGMDSEALHSLLEGLNYEGKTPFAIAAEANNTKIALFLADKLPELNLCAKDTLKGDTAFHHALRFSNFELIQYIFDTCEDKINVANHRGESPYELGMKSD
jgi:ankyrin repeat protein